MGRERWVGSLGAWGAAARPAPDLPLGKALHASPRSGAGLEWNETDGKQVYFDLLSCDAIISGPSLNPRTPEILSVKGSREDASNLFDVRSSI
ncbi:MAG: hypothetical protein CME61_08075 [Halobacteriovoraceae bacterium]|nr:hypothetical protein [Halobacteriovoraceae bacterium]